MHVAVLIDAENMPAEHADRILEHARSIGETNIVRVFGDFSGSKYAEWCRYAQSHGYETIVQANAGGRKNSTDIALAISAMDILHQRQAEAFCLVSNDRDFLPLAVRLRGAGRDVHVVCRTADLRLKNVCSSVVVLDSPEESILAAFLAVSGGRDKVLLREVGALLRRSYPSLFTSRGPGVVRKALLRSNRLQEYGEGNALSIGVKSA